MLRVLVLCLALVAGWSAERPAVRAQAVPPSVTLPVEFPLLISGGTLACRGTIDGHAGILLIDSGSSVTCLFPSQTRARRYRFRTVDLVAYTAAGPHRVGKVARRAEVRVAGVTYPARNLVVLPEGGETEAIGLLGCDFLLATGARIDLARRVVVLTKRP